MKCLVEKVDELDVLVLEGEITVQDVRQLRQTLLTSIVGSRGLVVDTEGVTRADLSVLQVLCSAHRNAMAVNKPMGFRESTNSRIRTLAVESGYARAHGCKFDSSHSCLWVTGGKA